MANREENLKKINDELEKLTDEQLEQVAGGTYWETADDSVLLKELGLLDESYSESDILWSSDTSREQKVYDAFQKLGIGLTYHGGAIKNGYYFGQKSLTHKEAHILAEAQAEKLGLGKYSK